VKIIYFSKFDERLSVHDLGEKVKVMGFDGIDLVVRPGHPVNPDNVSEVLPKAQRTWKSQGIEAAMITTNMDFLNPQAPLAKRLYAVCNETNIKWVKIGYWAYKRGQNYWEEVDKIRKTLEEFEKLSRKYEVKTCYHAHSGPLYGSNCAGLMCLIRGFDPEYIGAYVDTGHLFLDGEDYEMGLAMVREYLCLIALKDVVYIKDEEDGELIDKRMFVKLGGGLVPWKKFFGLLLSNGYDGPLSIHGEYELRGLDKRIRDKWVEEDLEFIRSILKKVQKQ